MLDIDETLVDLTSISGSAAEALELQNWDVVQLSLSPTSDHFPELTTCIIQVVVRDCREGSSGDSEKRPPILGIHPLLYEHLCTAYFSIYESKNHADKSHNETKETSEDQKFWSYLAVSAVPLSIPGAMTLALNDVKMFPAADETLPWTIKHVKKVQKLSPESTISLSCLFLDDQLRDFYQQSSHFILKLKSTLSFFLEGRLLMEGTTVLIPTPEGMAIAVVNEITKQNPSEQDADGDVVYRVGGPDTYFLEVACNESLVHCKKNESFIEDDLTALSMTWETECPGYEKLLHELLQLVTMTGPAAPSGTLLTGSPQVGKSHVASCVAHKLMSTGTAEVHWVSVQDLLLQATWANESDLMKMLQRRSQQALFDKGQLLVIDDLHILNSNESSLQDTEQTNVDPELLLVLNSILQVIDNISSENNARVAILGIGQSSKNLPKELIRFGRLEKEVAMSLPTQGQREAILKYLIPRIMPDNSREFVGENTTIAQRWAEALSPVTVGCLAGDICRLLTAAWTRASARSWKIGMKASPTEVSWRDLQEVTRTYVPLQLIDVDVCKPELALSEASSKTSDDWAKIHELSWTSFGGYANVKKRLLRTVVGPWKRFLASLDGEDEEVTSRTMGLSPPPGVLFHGPSGNGKSFAATCLGSSLGLPMIKVRASDVMDKWLGGSEAIIRSLFTRARAAAPCILMFDEIDAVASNRASADEGSSDVMSRLLSTLLNEMDGISNDKRRSSVLVVACTNRLKDLDAALLRPGRLEEHIEFEYPSAGDIKAILNIYLQRVPLVEEIDLDRIASELAAKNATGADLEGICREACFIALRRAKSTAIVLSEEDLLDAIDISRL